MLDTYSLFLHTLESVGKERIIEYLNVNKGTVDRWLLLKDVPKNYHFDLSKLSGIDIDYSQYSYRDKDQFFTPEDTVSYCLQVLKDKLKSLSVSEEGFLYLEPSAGSGNFLKSLPVESRVGLDIEPRDTEVLKQDFLDWTVPEGTQRLCVVGNPPFGLRGHTALRFINHAADLDAEFVAFVLPQLFESDGRGSPRNRIPKLNLIHTERLVSCFEDPDGKQIPVNTVFQIWSKDFEDPDLKKDEFPSDLGIKIYSLSDGGTPGTTRNKKHIEKCDVYLPSTCFGESKMRAYESFEDLPGRKGYGILISNAAKKNELKNILLSVNWDEFSFRSTNSALNLRTSIIKSAFYKNLPKEML